jgi:hypothetical protein
MGSQVLIGVLFLVILFSMINSSLNHRQSYADIQIYGYVKYSASRDIARAAINLSLKNRELNGPSGFNISGNLDRGSYTVSATPINDTTFRLVSTGKFEDTLYTVRTTLRAYPKPFPGIGGAVSLHIDSVGSFDLQHGNNPKIYIDGQNYDTSGNNPILATGVPGVAVMNSYDSTKVLASKDSANIIGNPGDIQINPALTDPASFIPLYIDAADNKLVASGSGTTTFSGNTVNWGTSNDPKITYIEATDPSAQAKISMNGNTDGWGILVVNGNVNFTGNGNLTWHGLVIMYGTSQIQVTSLGSMKIIGALLMGGANGSTYDMNGSAQVLYSSEALRKASLVGHLLAYRVVDWYE